MYPFKTTLFLAFFLALFTTANAQTSKPKVKNYGSSLYVKVKGQTKEQISEKTNDWLEATLSRSQFSPRNIDVDEGIFLGVGSFTDSAGIVQFEMSLYAKKNGVQMVFDADFHKKNHQTDARLNDNYLRRKAQQYFQDLAKDLEAYLNRS